MKLARLGTWALIVLTILQLLAALLALYLWGFGAEVSRDLGTALVLGPCLTGLPALFLIVDGKHL